MSEDWMANLTPVPAKRRSAMLDCCRLPCWQVGSICMGKQMQVYVCRGLSQSRWGLGCRAAQQPPTRPFLPISPTPPPPPFSPGLRAPRKEWSACACTFSRLSWESTCKGGLCMGLMVLHERQPDVSIILSDTICPTCRCPAAGPVPRCPHRCKAIDNGSNVERESRA